MHNKTTSQSGFTLVEIAIVLIIVTILLGYTVAMFPIQQELRQYRQANAEMEEIKDALIAFAQVNGRLPCPDTAEGSGAAVNGEEERTEEAFPTLDTCNSIYAFLPAKTLGIQGDFDAISRLLDPWGEPYRYGVSDGSESGDPADNPEDNFVDQNNIKAVGIGGMEGDIFVCNNSTNAATYLTCTAAGTTKVMSKISAIIVSTGKDQGRVSSNIQNENMDNFNNAGQDDRVYVHTQRNDTSGGEYDDVVKWLPTNLLLSKMIEADQLP